MRCLGWLSVAGLLTLTASAVGAEGGQVAKDGVVELKLVAKKDRYVWDGGGLTPADFRKQLDKLAEDQKNKQGFGAKVPPAPTVDLLLQISNTSKEDVTVYLGGTANVFTFDLKGPAAVALKNPGPMPAIIVLPRAITLKPGESFDIPVTKLMDGRRGMSRLLYWAEPGEYTLSATYQLSDSKGGATQLLKSESVKITVELPK
jgi:hypothetical protein